MGEAEASLAESLAHFPRLAQRLARRLGKRVQWRAEGLELRVARPLAKAVRVCLLHLVRNALDHGIESPPERRAHGKAESGCLEASFSWRGDVFVARLTDDGRGLDRERIPDHDLIFRSGFSTASQVSTVSGRGVGLDVVRTTVETLGGRARVESLAGTGTSFSLEFPRLGIRVGDDK